jgi:hypothetical protein
MFEVPYKGKNGLLEHRLFLIFLTDVFLASSSSSFFMVWRSECFCYYVSSSIGRWAESTHSFSDVQSLPVDRVFARSSPQSENTPNTTPCLLDVGTCGATPHITQSALNPWYISASRVFKQVLDRWNNPTLGYVSRFSGC